MTEHNIYYDPHFDECAKGFGGVDVVDVAISPIIDGLKNNPYAFPSLGVAGSSLRYAVTKRVGQVPPLIVAFEIDEDGDVIMRSLYARRSE